MQANASAVLNSLTVKLLKTKLGKYEPAKLRLKLQGVVILFGYSFVIINSKPLFVALSFSIRS
jgi:hypothetical protein